MSSGDKLLVFRHPLHPHMLILAHIADMQEMQEQMARTMALLQEQLSSAESASEEEGSTGVSPVS